MIYNKKEGGYRMKKTTALKIINPLIAILILNQISTGILHQFFNHEVFEIIHEVGGIALFIGVLIHLILNWNWVKTSYFK
jgi:hypothetical protein